MGLYFKARIDGGPVLRMLLDSGAQHIVLDKRAATKVGRTAGSGFELVGVGASSNQCRRTAPGAIEIGDLVLQNCDILVVDGQISRVSMASSPSRYSLSFCCVSIYREKSWNWMSTP